jgi:hypothetical protein
MCLVFDRPWQPKAFPFDDLLIALYDFAKMRNELAQCNQLGKRPATEQVLHQSAKEFAV